MRKIRFSMKLALNLQNCEYFSCFSVFEECGPVSMGTWTDNDVSYTPYRSFVLLNKENLLKCFESITKLNNK